MSSKYSKKPPIKLTVWSNDLDLIRTNITIKVHPDTKCSFLLQYIHYLVFKKDKIDKIDINNDNDTIENSVSSFCLLNKFSRELDLNEKLSVLYGNFRDEFTRIQFERRTNNSGTAVNLDYDITSDINIFEDITIRYFINNLPKKTDQMDKKVLHSSQKHLNLQKTTISKLRKIALLGLQKYEIENDSFCDIGKFHSIDDITGFIVRGDSKLKILNSDNEDMTLSQLLNIDIPPNNQSKFEIMFKINHSINKTSNDEKINDDETTFIEFIPHMNMTLTRMPVNETTTVQVVRNFICANCFEVLNCKPDDFKLIYQGKLIEHSDENILNIVDKTKLYKIYIHYKKQENDLKYGFWKNAVNSSTKKQQDSSNNKSEKSIKREDITPTPTIPSISSMPSSKLDETTYITESGKRLIPTGEIYEKFLLDDKEVFIKRKENDNNSLSTRIEINGQSLNLNPQDFIIDVENNLIKLSPSLIPILESKFNITLKQSTGSTSTTIPQSTIPSRTASSANMGRTMSSVFQSSTDTSNNTASINIPDAVNIINHIEEVQNDNNRALTMTEFLTNFALSFWNFVPLIGRTFYLLGISSFGIILLLLEFSTFIPLPLTILISFILIIRGILMNDEIVRMWSPYVRRVPSIVKDDRKLNIIKNYLSKNKIEEVDKRLNSKLLNSMKDDDLTMNMLSMNVLSSERDTMYRKYDITNADDKESLKQLLSSNDDELYPRENEKVIESERTRDIREYFLICLRLYETQKETFTKAEVKSLNAMLDHIYQHSIKSNHRDNIITVIKKKFKEWWRYFGTTNLLRSVAEHVTPDPSNDMIIVQGAKLIALFLLLLITPLREHVRAVVSSRSHAPENNNTINTDQLPANTDATNNDNIDADTNDNNTTNGAIEHENTTNDVVNNEDTADNLVNHDARDDAIVNNDTTNDDANNVNTTVNDDSITNTFTTDDTVHTSGSTNVNEDAIGDDLTEGNVINEYITNNEVVNNEPTKEEVINSDIVNNYISRHDTIKNDTTNGDVAEIDFKQHDADPTTEKECLPQSRTPPTEEHSTTLDPIGFATLPVVANTDKVVQEHGIPHPENHSVTDKSTDSSSSAMLDPSGSSDLKGSSSVL